MRDIFGVFSTISLIDLVDIFLVAVFFYFTFSLLKGTRSWVALRGLITLLLICLLIYFLARILNLTAVEMIFSNMWIVVVLVFMIVFQNEFRKALTDLGQLRAFRVLFTQNREYVTELVKAVRIMSTRHVGALIGIERRNSLKAYSETGTRIDASISAELLRTIFTPYSPTHDGAAIISNDRITAVTCILPLTASSDLSKDLGTRHRAAIGLSEETDAVVIVVSEETGTISIAINGILERGLSPDELKKRLQAELDMVEKVGEDDGETLQ